jgi:FkbM family methyltransferase
MKTENIYEISKDRPLKSAEIFQPNDFYGHASIIKKYVKLPENYQLKAAIEHGAGIGGNIWDQNINNVLPAMFTSSFYRSRILKNKTSKKIFIIGPKIQYARHYLNEEELKIKKETLGKNLLSFPAHSTHYVNTHYDIQKYCQFLKDFGKNYQSIRICLYWKDILRGLDKEYERFGFQVETAGHMFDPLFLSRLKSIIEAATFTTSNNIGTILGYCVILNKPHLLIESEIKKDSQYKDKLLECSDLTDQSDAIDIREAFTELQEHVTPKQKEIVNKYWGIDEFKSVEEMGAIINECEKLYQKRTGVYFSQNKPKDDEFLFKGSFEEVLHEIGKVIETYPRRKKGLLEIDNRAFYFSDLHSFYHQAIQIFKSDIYGFKTDRDNPVILDCGAHVGLASIYFATKYPNSSVHAFEADPAIAKMLTENINSFGLRMVNVHPQAVWINEEGVCFNKSGDDSGFISDEKPENIEKVSSIRLKKFIENQHVDLLKLDIEGAEYDVIKDCDEALANVKSIIIEVHKFRDHNGSLGEILGILEKNNFEYTFGDFHFAEWLEPSLIPPFLSCRTNKYIITIFAWQPGDRKSNSVENQKNMERALKELNAGHNSKAILLIKKAIQEVPGEKALYYALAVAHAREENFFEAKKLLAQIPENNHIYDKASYLLEMINDEIQDKHRGE